ncbi:hypothetical protein T459_11357 [Capsicum annuum]|uniref:NAF domain-containing protein n=1 Tax=Capsicum annuum TaxID=4072 RepID=A0A2G2ZLX4_CAPAN|nr:hypothetical protein T459_11357 [Capsicum annuum]
MKPASLNAFDIISLFPFFVLSNLVEKDKSCRSDARFTTQNSASTIVSRLEEIDSIGSFKTEKWRPGLHGSGTHYGQGPDSGRDSNKDILELIRRAKSHTDRVILFRGSFTYAGMSDLLERVGSSASQFPAKPMELSVDAVNLPKAQSISPA